MTQCNEIRAAGTHGVLAMNLNTDLCGSRVSTRPIVKGVGPKIKQELSGVLQNICVCLLLS